MVLLPNTDENTTKKRYNRIKEKFKKLNERDKLLYPINISLGCATVNNKVNIYSCYERSDYNMYKNKKAE